MSNLFNVYTLEEFYKHLEKQSVETYIVRLSYRYNWEKRPHVENVIIDWDSNENTYVWDYDWDDGYTSNGVVYVLGYIKLSDVDIYAKNLMGVKYG